MKKKLESELISIAHRILKLKNKSELDQLCVETQRLYEKLAVLKFVEENFANLKPTIGHPEANAILETAFDATPVEPVKTEEIATSAAVNAHNEDQEVAEVASEEKTSDKKDNPEETPQKDEEEIQEPEQPEEEKLEASETPIAGETPIEKEVDELLAEAENDTPTEEIAEEPSVAISIEEASKQTQDEQTVVEQGISFEEPEAKEEVAAAIGETSEMKQEDLFKPSFEWAFEAKAEEKTDIKGDPKSQIAFEDLLGKGYVDPVFVKPEDIKSDYSSYSAPETPKQDVIPITRINDKVPVYKMGTNDNSDKAVSLNDRLSKGITVGLNDRIAFVKNLFNNSNEDYNRVLSQLITFDTLDEAQDFIDNMVKPDYGNWDGKDEYAQRFMEVVEKKFN